MDDAMAVKAESEAARVEAAVEGVLEAGANGVRTDAEKQEAARGVYLTWRNACLGDLPTESFSRVEAASGTLISAIAQLLS